MSVASHLGIRIADYDARIRTFIPDYEQMLATGAAALPPGTRTIVDLGIGTGAFAARCLAVRPRARIVGVDADAAMLDAARRRLGGRLTGVAGSFLRAPLPDADAVIASFSLHHVRTPAAKYALYRRIRRALRPRGRVVIVDCQPAGDRPLARAQFAAWKTHLRRSYSPAAARALLRAWAREDRYLPLERDAALLASAGFQVEVLWRRGAFAVWTGRPEPRAPARARR